MSTGYHIYSNTGAGDPINYTSPVATITSPATTTWSSSALTHPGTWSFGVRAFDTVSGLEERNLDCKAERAILDSERAAMHNLMVAVATKNCVTS